MQGAKRQLYMLRRPTVDYGRCKKALAGIAPGCTTDSPEKTLKYQSQSRAPVAQQNSLVLASQARIPHPYRTCEQ